MCRKLWNTHNLLALHDGSERDATLSPWVTQRADASGLVFMLFPFPGPLLW